MIKTVITKFRASNLIRLSFHLRYHLCQTIHEHILQHTTFLFVEVGMLHFSIK